MSTGLLLAMAISSSGPWCAPVAVPEGTKWLGGAHKAEVVRQQDQASVLRGLRRNGLKEISVNEAKRLTGNNNLAPGLNYYVSRVGYIGGAGSEGRVPSTINLSLEVSDRNVGYVTSFRLTRARTVTDIAVVLASASRLEKAESSCMAAE